MSRIHFAVFLIAFTATVGAAGGADPTETFESAGEAELAGGFEGQATCAIAEDPGKTGNHVLRVDWEPASATHIGVNLKRSTKELLTKAGSYTVTARVNLEQASPECSSMAFRLVDATRNEVYQFSAPLENQGHPGWQTVSW